MGRIEKTVANLCDFIIGILFLILLYQVFFGAEFSFMQEESESAAWFGLILGMGILWLGGKVLKAILCSIARALDIIFGVEKNENS